MKPRSTDREPFLRNVSLARDIVPDWDRHPYSLPIIRGFDSLDFHPAVTFLVGENGSGKSTLIEAMAIRMDFTEIGGLAQKGLSSRFNNREVDGGLHDSIRLHYNRRRLPSDTFYMRAETVFEFSNWLDEQAKDDPRWYGRFGNRSLHTRSHGEAFLTIIQQRLIPECLVLMDEPESALSPSRQLTFLKELDWLVRQGSQFIIATHSPILLAYPDAQIYQLSESKFEPVSFEDTEHFRTTRDFLNHREAFLRHLVE